MGDASVANKTGLILLEDEQVLAEEICDFLDEFGYRVTHTQSLSEFRQHFNAERHPLAIIDLGLPDGDGLTLISHLRHHHPKLGIVAFTARAGTEQRISGYTHGVDHYLTKGCDLYELSAVLEALRRRILITKKAPVWNLDLRPNVLTAPNGQSLKLSHQETVVLHCFMRSAGHTVSKREVIEALDSDYISYDLRRLDTQIHRLRRNIEQATGLALPLKTLRNSGYSFYEPVLIVTLAEPVA